MCLGNTIPIQSREHSSILFVYRNLHTINSIKLTFLMLEPIEFCIVENIQMISSGNKGLNQRIERHSKHRMFIFHSAYTTYSEAIQSQCQNEKNCIQFELCFFIFIWYS